MRLVIEVETRRSVFIRRMPPCLFFLIGIDDAMYPSNTFLLLQELTRGVHYFKGGSSVTSSARRS
jgi:hypothetical protein